MVEMEMVEMEMENLRNKRFDLYFLLTFNSLCGGWFRDSNLRTTIPVVR
jgi:hypothetical protein